MRPLLSSPHMQTGTTAAKRQDVDRLTRLPREVLENVLAHAATTDQVLDSYARTCNQAARSARLFAERVLTVQQSSLLNRADQSTVLGGRGADLPASRFSAENEQSARNFLTRLANNTPPQRAKLLLTRARADRAQENFSEAAEGCRQALALHPTLFGAHTLLGDMLRTQERASDAEASYRAALALQPRSYDALVGLARLYRQQNRLAEADACSQQAIEHRPQSAEALAARGRELSLLGRHQEATINFLQAIDLDGDDDASYAGLISLFSYDMRNKTMALPLYRTLLRLRPQAEEVLLDFVDVLVTLKRQEEAQRVFSNFFRKMPNFMQHVQEFRNTGLTSSSFIQTYTFGTSLTLGGLITAMDPREKEHAERVLREATTLVPSHVRAHVHLGEFLLDGKRWPEAEEAFRQAISLSPHDARAVVGLYYAIDEQDDSDPEEVKSTLEKALDLNPRDLTLLESMARMHNVPGPVIYKNDWV